MHDDHIRKGDNAWTRRVVVATVAILVVYTAWYLLRYTDFDNDDLDFLVIMKHSGFWSFVLTPADVHYVPLHQFLTWFAYQLAPMNYKVPVAILMAFHVGTLIYLGRSLRLLNAGQAGGLIVCAYAASGLVIFVLFWWCFFLFLVVVITILIIFLRCGLRLWLLRNWFWLRRWRRCLFTTEILPI